MGNKKRHQDNSNKSKNPTTQKTSEYASKTHPAGLNKVKMARIKPSTLDPTQPKHWNLKNMNPYMFQSPVENWEFRGYTFVTQAGTIRSSRIPRNSKTSWYENFHGTRNRRLQNIWRPGRTTANKITYRYQNVSQLAAFFQRRITQMVQIREKFASSHVDSKTWKRKHYTGLFTRF